MTDLTNDQLPEKLEGLLAKTCETCGGEGKVEHAHLQGPYGGSHAECPPDTVIVDCENCDGTGEVEHEA